MTTTQLRDYQAECISIIERKPPGSYLIQMATGMGKTATFTHIPRHGRVLVLAHREELIRQPARYYDCPVGFEMALEHSHGEEVVIASVQSLARRLDRFDPGEFDTIITDECFPAGTLVDGKPIEEIRAGDFVWSFNHEKQTVERRKVSRVFKNPVPARLVCINRSVLCTENHPFYSVKEGKYVEAKNIISGDCLLRNVWQGAPLGGTDEEPEGQLLGNQKGVLLQSLLSGVLPESFVGNNDENEPQICFGADEEIESHVESGYQAENGSDPAKNPTQTACAGWEWKRNDSSSERTDGQAAVSESDRRVHCPDQPAKIQCVSSSISLQNRYCNHALYDCDRGGWREPLRGENPGSGREEICVLEVQRVDSVTILEPGCHGECGHLCPDGFVYNIEVEGNHNYFANGYLVHNCHHASAGTYRKIYDHFTPRKHLGFTATPNRGDRGRLDDVFQEIIFQRDLRWAIEKGYLCDIYCLRVNIGYDLSAVRTRNGDYAPGELNEAMDGTADAIAQAYREHAKGATLIFAVSVHQAEEIAKRIPGAVVVTGKTKDREDIIRRFTNREIPCIVNVMVFTEGTDMPLVETVIVARPTQSDTLYTQMVGRGLRQYPGKKKLTLIDCVGVTGKASLCTAPSLLGIDLSNVPARKADEIQGPLFELPIRAAAASDCPESWIRNVEIVDLWAKEMSYNLHNVNWFKMPDGRLICSLSDNKRIVIPCPDSLGRVRIDGEEVPYQEALDRAYKALCESHEEDRFIWDLDRARNWGRKPASDKQIAIIRRKYRDFDTDGLTKLQANQILSRMFNGRKRK